MFPSCFFVAKVFLRSISIRQQPHASSNLDYGFDESALWFKPARELCDDFAELDAVRDPRSDVEFAGFELIDDPLKFNRRRVAAAQKRQFAAVRVRVMKRHVALK